MFQTIKERCAAIANNFKEIPAERKQLLQKIADYIKTKQAGNEAINLIYVCTVSYTHLTLPTNREV